MARPTKIIDRYEFTIGIVGMVLIVSSIWRMVFVQANDRFSQFIYLILLVFCTIFFSWMILSNIRKKKEYTKKKKRQVEFDGTNN